MKVVQGTLDAPEQQTGRLKKRAYGSGSVFESNGKWHVVVRVAGRRIHRRAASWAEANKIRLELLRKPPAAKGGRRLVVQAAHEWLENLHDRAPQTRVTHRRVIERFIAESALGKCRLDQLTNRDFEGLVAEMAAESYSNNTKIQVLSVLRQVFKREMRNGHVEVRCVALVPTVKRRTLVQPVALNQDQVRKLLEACASDSYGPLFAVIATTGMRVGEALSLRWKRVDFELGLVTVAATVIDLSDPYGALTGTRLPNDAKYVIQEHTKAADARDGRDRSRKTILTQGLKQMLLEIRETQRKAPPRTDGRRN